MADPRDLELQMDPSTLCREEIYTDRQVGVIRVLVPVKDDGSEDKARTVVYSGEAQIVTQLGPLPITFEIEAKSLAEAIGKYGDAAKVAVERTLKELQEMRRQAASSLLVPGAGGMGGMPGGGFAPGGGMRGGGKIQMP